ncbi:unnamed protein product [Rotaria sordida]|uniref:Mab-21-like HhH/H2TH-like domain-containing protein n=1 Tax=Rotaria sordida TaxID=392033 RepID=A0A818X212_9BILA|nr:unnamed protein product [Rotaria sordida]
MATTVTDGSRALLSGSTAEGQTYARHLANQNIQDIDILLHCGSVKSEKNLIKTHVPGFVRIKFDDEIEATGSVQFTSEEDTNGIRCLNGFKLKQGHCTIEPSSEKKIGAPLSYVSRSGQTSSDSSDAAAAQKLEYQTIDISKQFREALINTENQRYQFNFDTVRNNYVLFSRGVCQSISEYAIPLYRTPHSANMFEEENINEQTFRDLFTLVGPAYDYNLPKMTRDRIAALLDFYDKYKQVGNPKSIVDMADYFQSCAPVDMDFVPSLQLKFWPSDVHSFLERIKKNRPEIYKFIKDKISMHVIPKWSTKTAKCDRELEFRYSFSAIELYLAQQRSHNEQVLNGIARSIYYKFLKEHRTSTQHVIPSYFIKTTVLWMCEMMDLNNENPETLAKKWIQYAIDLLNKGYCPHYFIENLNILEPYSRESLEEARKILLKVDVNEIHKIQMFSATSQKLHRDEYNKNVAYFLNNLKASDIVNALYDYRRLKKTWPRLTSDLIIDDDEADMGATFTILNILRALDGDYDNWHKFRKIFLESRPSFPPIWGKEVNADSTIQFTKGLLSIGIILTLMNENISSNNILSAQGVPCNIEDFKNYQNVIHQYLNPKTLYSNMQSTYSYFYNQSISAFERRKLTDYHPYGPEMTHDPTKIENGFYKVLMDLCRNTDDNNLTLRQLCQQQQMNNIDDDELMAIAIQMSMDDAKQ